MDRFSEQVKHRPEQTAIEYGACKVSYSELNTEICSLVKRLTSYSCGNGSMIGIFLDKGVLPITAMLSILKLRATYVYVDTNFPNQRVVAMLKKIQPQIIITTGELKDRLKTMGIREDETLSILDIEKSSMDCFPKTRLTQSPPNQSTKESDPNEIAYIYFTSGSSGAPKAIMGTYTLLNFYVEWFVRTFEVTENDRFSQVAPLSFDTCIREIFVPLVSGACIVIPANKDIHSANHYLQWLDDRKISIFSCVPNIFRILIKDSIRSQNDFVPALSAMKKIIIVGEVLYYSDVKRWISVFGRRIDLINFYGTTETLSKSYFLINKYMLSELDIVPIGKGAESSQLLIIMDGELCGVKQKGELYIRSRYITAGYLDDQGLTDQVFIQNPLHSRYKDIVYKTGDLAYYLPDGNVVLSGRIDNQVKFHGVRIEMSEIETSLIKYPGVDSAAVILHTDGDKDELVCFFTAEKSISSDEVKEYLSLYLPAVLIPQRIIQLDAMPLNTNGKLDRSALIVTAPKDENVNAVIKEEWGEIHRNIHEIWCEVLGIDSIGMDENFFQIGGNSLLLMQIVNRINERYQCDLKILDLYLNATIQKLVKHVSESTNMRPKVNFMPISSILTQDDYPASNAQSRLWMLNHMDQEGISHNMYSILKLDGNLDIYALEKAMSLLVERHESLRTIFQMINSEVRQIILEPISVSISLIELNERDDLTFEDHINLAIKKRFDLSRLPLFFINVYKVKENEYICLFNIHHIIFDGWSSNVLIREWTEIYDSIVNGKTPKLHPLTLQYKDYSAWQSSFIKEHDEMKQYWFNKLNPYRNGLDLPSDYTRPIVRTFQGDVFYFELGEKLHHKINSFCMKYQTNQFVFFVAVIKILLCRLSNQYGNTSIGTPITNRNHLGLEDQIGFYVNTIVLADSLSDRTLFIELIKQIHTTVAEAFENQLYPYDKLVEDLGLRRDLSRNPIFDVMVVMQNYVTQNFTSDHIKVKLLDLPAFSSKFDLVFTFQSETDELKGKIEYNTNLYKRSTIENYFSYLKSLIIDVLENESKPISEYNIVPESMRNKILNEFNKTTDSPSNFSDLVTLFQKKATEFRDNPALHFDNQIMTYGELDEASDKFAAYLYHRGVTKGVCVGVRMKRSFTMMIAVFGILKAGGVYTPLDPDLPSNREKDILEDCNAAILLVDQGGATTSYEVTTIELTKEFLDDMVTESNINYQVSADDIAYIIYTSGSTGKPKGVVIEHRSIVNRLEWQSEAINMDENDVLVQKTSISFDVSIYELFTWIFKGGSLVMLTHGSEKDPFKLIDEISKHGVSVIHFVPSMLQMFLLYLRNHPECMLKISSLRCVISSGEILKKSHVKEFFELFDEYDVKLLNLYGPTEASVDVSYFWCNKEDSISPVPIGRPIDNIQLYVLDSASQLCPVGVPGELFISGVGVARGYLNNPNLTTERFLNCPFNPPKKLYRTGDLARWLDTGNIEYLGRMDRQVKIRGYRIELSEIESKLADFPYIEQTAVMCKNDANGDPYIAAFVVANDKFDTGVVKQDLARNLPEYMIPTVFKQVPYIPLSISGKVDQKILDDIIIPEQRKVPLIQPNNYHEKIVAGVYKKILDREDISISDNFFDIGGSSIKAIQAVEYFYTDYGMKIEVLTIFQFPNIRALAAHLRGMDANTIGTSQSLESASQGKKAINRLRKNTINKGW